ncbi:MAG: hypothetical protein AVO34_13170 [Firmicutes bacterium ML8_F2]|jgi:multimeric flavodoxin WrbA|nr:MAG: hypothetical protein AVO34_13170 [Firmicutes bacterium ML8_F2]
MKKLKVLGICASPRSKGNMEYILGRCLEAMRRNGGDEVEIKRYLFRAKKMNPCLDCGGCYLSGECVIRDDFQRLKELWLEADIVVYAVPVYHLGLPGQLKCFIDRLGQSICAAHSDECNGKEETMPKYLKVIAPLTLGIHQVSGQEQTIMQIINHALIMQCLPVSGDAWQCYTGAGGWTQNREEKDAIEKLAGERDFSTLALIKAIETTALRALQLARVVRDGLIACREELAGDAQYRFVLDKHCSD